MNINLKMENFNLNHYPKDTELFSHIKDEIGKSYDPSFPGAFSFFAQFSNLFLTSDLITISSDTNILAYAFTKTFENRDEILIRYLKFVNQDNIKKLSEKLFHSIIKLFPLCSIRGYLLASSNEIMIMEIFNFIVKGYDFIEDDFIEDVLISDNFTKNEDEKEIKKFKAKGLRMFWFPEAITFDKIRKVYIFLTNDNLDYFHQPRLFRKFLNKQIKFAPEEVSITSYCYPSLENNIEELSERLKLLGADQVRKFIIDCNLEIKLIE